MKAQPTPLAPSNCLLRTVIRSGILLLLLGFLVVPFFSSAASLLPFASNATATGGGADPSALAHQPFEARQLLGLVAPSSLAFLPVPQQAGEVITLYRGDCTTPDDDFDLGEAICAKLTGAPIGTRVRRRLAIVNPGGLIVAQVNVTSDPQILQYTLPSEQFSTYGETTVDNRGTWRVNNISTENGSVRGTLKFSVHDPQTPVANLTITKNIQGADQAAAGDIITFSLLVTNNGPDSASTVQFTDSVPSDTTFVTGFQDSGPTFTCTHPTPASSTGQTVCTISSLAAGDSALFQLSYKIDAFAATGTAISNTATISSATAEGHALDNSSTSSVTVSGSGGGGSGICSIGCPDDIQTQANTTQSGEDGAIVHFSQPSGNDECGPVITNHCNDCFFPVGTTVVTANSALTGESCSFTVIVTPAGSSPTTVSCPANQSGNADGSCNTVFNLGTASATGTNVTVVASRSDGKPVYTCDEFGNCTRNSSDPSFSVGISTVTWTAYSHDIPGPYNATTGDEETRRTGNALCTQTITVNDVTPPTIGATNTTVAANASCQGAVPDFSNTVADNCACSASDDSEECQTHNDIGYTQSPAAGTLLGPGTHTVHIEANDGTNNATKDITLTVADQTAPTITCPANMTANTAPGTCAAAVDPGTATATDNCDSSVTITGTRSDSQPLNAPYPKGTTTITWRATDDAGNFSECAQTITVEDHENPVIVCPANITAGTDAPSCSATVNPGQPTATDNCGSTTITSSRSDGQPMNAPYPKGTTTITWTATDSSGNHASCTQTVTVVDDDAPVITFAAQQSMWPPNHKYQTFQMSSFVTGVNDNCDGPIGVSSVVITKVTSDEIENGNGDGNTLNDIVIAANCKSVQLRSEREGNGNGRVYTIFFSVTDAAGNKGTGTTKVVVPHNPGETAVDSGPHYTVMSNCP